jgi:2-isopropylmalate synthase
MLGRELLPTEITKLFEEAYHLKHNPRFSLVDYEITADRSKSPAPPQEGKTQSSRNLRRIFKGVIEIDHVEHQIQGSGNGAISSLADALRGLGIELDVVDYNEHTIGTSKDAKAATYIGCTAQGSNTKVWGVGIHHDVVQASLIALLSAASSVSEHQYPFSYAQLIPFKVLVFKTNDTHPVPPETVKYDRDTEPGVESNQQGEEKYRGYA